MRVTGPDMHWPKQRRRRLVAAVLCLGVLAGAALATFLTERPSAHGAAAGAAGAVPSPQPLGSSPVAYPLGAPGALGTPGRSALRPSSSGTPGPAVVGPAVSAPSTGAPSPLPSAAGSAQAKSGAQNAPQVAGTAPAPSMTVSNPLAASAFAGLPQVGALFSYTNGATTSHFCSGSVVSSQPGDIVVTAAHCVYDTASGTNLNGIAFVPGYHDGQQPYGVWTPSQILVPQQWIDSGDPDYDFAFLVVHQPGSTARIQDQVGADQLGLNPDYDGIVQVAGYPDDTEQPVTCTDYTKELSATQLEFDCPGFPDGTSGAPFLADVDRQTGRGTLVGVIGGYQTGGDTPDISYSSYFGSAVGDLFNQAQAAG